MKTLKSMSVITLLISLIACSQPDTTSKEKTLINQGHHSSLVGSLVKSDIPSPEKFYKEVINDRSTFQSTIQNRDNEIDQMITNTDGSFSSVIFWEKKDNQMEVKGIAINIVQPITPDNLQVLKRLALRLNDSNTIEKAILNNSKYKILSNGAGITIKSFGDRIQYEIY